MKEAMKERISALADGELSEFEVRRVLEEIENDPELREFWKRIQLIKLGFGDQPLGFLSSDISSRVARELGQSITERSKESSYILNGKLALVACLSVVLSGTYFYTASSSSIQYPDLFAQEASNKINEAINSPEAISLLDNAVQGMNAKLQSIDSGDRGQFYADYRIPSNGKTFKVSLSPLDSKMSSNRLESSRVSYLRTKNGIFLVSVSGNISDETKNQILKNVNLKDK
ncbi:MAG: sigma-E factor negative regulatory protein [Gammaproteobacteria bacterium]